MPLQRSQKVKQTGTSNVTCIVTMTLTLTTARPLALQPRHWKDGFHPVKGLVSVKPANFEAISPARPS
jgi:hypothetical protein